MLTHFGTIFSFYTPWKQSYPFRGYAKKVTKLQLRKKTFWVEKVQKAWGFNCLNVDVQHSHNRGMGLTISEACQCGGRRDRVFTNHIAMMKRNDETLYNDSKSNHTTYILKRLPLLSKTSLSNFSSNLEFPEKHLNIIQTT